jgi:hypothetical protein
MGWKVRSILAGCASLLILGIANSGGRKLRFGPAAPPPFPLPAPAAQPSSLAKPSGPSAPLPPTPQAPQAAAVAPALPGPPALQPSLATLDAPRVLELPAHTRLKVILSRGLATDQDHIGDPWEGVLAQEVRKKGLVAWPRGTPVQGIILQSAPGNLLQGGGGLELRIRTVGGSDLEAGTYVVDGRNLEAGTAEPVVRIPAGRALTFALSAPKELNLGP